MSTNTHTPWSAAYSRSASEVQGGGGAASELAARLKALTILATGSPPACPMASAATLARCAMEEAPEVVWDWIDAAAPAIHSGA